MMEGLGAEVDPFEGWDQSGVGCYWTRAIVDGRTATSSTWSRGGDGGYSLTVDYQEAQFAGLGEALAAFDTLAAAARVCNGPLVSRQLRGKRRIASA